MSARIEPLAGHDRSRFSCGDAALDDWFRRQAGQDQRRNISRVFVAVDDDLGIVGFYSLSSFIVGTDDLPADLVRKLPRYEALPATLIGRLARDERVRGLHLGPALLADAVERIMDASRTVAVFAIVVDAKDERAASFYERFGFQRFPSRPLRLFLPAATAAEALLKASN